MAVAATESYITSRNLCCIADIYERHLPFFLVWPFLLAFDTVES